MTSELSASPSSFSSQSALAPSSFSKAYISEFARPFFQSVHSYIACQCFVSDASANRLVSESTNPSHCVNLAIAFIQSESEFINVALQMLQAEVVVRAIVTALEDSPHALDTVGVRHAINGFLGAVVDSAMPIAAHSIVGGMFIGAERRALEDIELHHSLNGFSASVRYDSSLHIAAPLAQTEHGSFAYSSATGPQFVGNEFVLFLAADIGLIGFNYTGQHSAAIGTVAASFTDTAQHEPCGLLRDAQLLGDLHAAHAFAGGRDQIHSIQPLVERDMRALENGVRADREVLFAGQTAEVANGSSDLDALDFSAMRTNRLTIPAAIFKVKARSLGIRELLQEFVMADRDFHGKKPHSMGRFYA